MKKEVSCGAIVYKIAHDVCYFLVIQGINSKSVGFPKGHVEANESFQETAIREVLEETGIEIEIISEQSYPSNYTFKPSWSNEEIAKEVHYFVARATTYKIKHSVEEIILATWMTKDEVFESLTHSADITIFKKVINDFNL